MASSAMQWLCGMALLTDAEFMVILLELNQSMQAAFNAVPPRPNKSDALSLVSPSRWCRLHDRGQQHSCWSLPARIRTTCDAHG